MVGRHRVRSWRVALSIGLAASLGVAACSSDSKTAVPATSGAATTAAGASTTAATTTGASTGASTGGTTGASTGGSTAPAGGSSDQALVIARDMDVNSLDPQRAYCDTCQIFMTAVYETLIGLDAKDNTTLIPRLATKWTSNTDQTEFTFDLDPRAKFADGTPVTSADVKFSWERLQGLKGASSYLVSLIKTIDATDPEVVKVTLSAADSAFFAQVNASYLGIVNSKAAMAQGATADPTTDKAEPWFLANSAGSGPFTLEGYTSGSELRLKRNDAYWGTKANFPEVIMKQTQGAVEQRQQLEEGSVDIAMQISNDVATGMSDKDVVVKKVPSFNYVYLALSPGAKGGEALTPDVRKAIREALDYPHLLDVTVGGAGRSQPSPIPNGFAGTTGLPGPVQNLDDAKQLLAASGAKDLTFDATFPTFNVYGVDFSTAMQEVQTELKAVGVTLNLNPVEVSVWADKINKDGIPVTMLYFAPDHTDSSQYVQYFGLVPDSQWTTWTKQPNVQSESDLLTKAFATQDPAARDGIYKQLAQAMIDDQVIIPIVNPDLFLASRANITGMHYSACCNLDLALLGKS
ncbi:MAG: extracellular solute-binding protein family 5 [Ilumatobacteraceae bacterium]|nr:extracellular solute-binding protein family 5 [Ilumatobacteraceae bacterium]